MKELLTKLIETSLEVYKEWDSLNDEIDSLKKEVASLNESHRLVNVKSMRSQLNAAKEENSTLRGRIDYLISKINCMHDELCELENWI